MSIVDEYRALHAALCDEADLVINGDNTVEHSKASRPSHPTPPLSFDGNRFHRTYWFGACGVALAVENLDLATGYYSYDPPNEIVVEAIATVQGYTGRGDGSRALKALRYGARLAEASPVLLCKPIKPDGINIPIKPVNADTLHTWYRRYGFVDEGDQGWMRWRA